MRHAQGLAAIVLPFLVLCGCSSIGVTVYQDDAAIKPDYGTYAWESEEPRESQTDRPLAPAAYEEIVSSVNAQLEQRGWEEVDAESADLLVTYSLFLKQRRETYEEAMWRPQSYRPIVEQQEFRWEEGTLMIDLVDRRSETGVWRGIAEAVVKQRRDGSQIDQAVAKMFKGFPSRP